MSADWLKKYEEATKGKPPQTKRDAPDRAKAIAEALEGCEDVDALVEAGKRERELTLEKYAPSTLSQMLNYYKSAFSGVELEQDKTAVAVATHDANGKPTGTRLIHGFIHGFNHSIDYYREEAAQKSKKTEGVENPAEIVPEKAIDAAAKLLNSDSHWDVAAGLILLTGRRPCEIMLTGEFREVTKSDTKNSKFYHGLEGSEYHAVFSGQAKKRGEEPEIIIALLAPYKVVLRAMRWLRGKSEVKSIISEVKRKIPKRGQWTDEKKYEAEKARRAEIDERTNSMLLQSVRQALGNDVPTRWGRKRTNNQGLRAAYLAMATRRDSDENATALEQLYLAGLYGGHVVPGEKKSDSELRHLLTTAGYMDFRVLDDVPYWKPESKHRPTFEAYTDDLDWLESLKENRDEEYAETLRYVFDVAKKVIEKPLETAESTTETTEKQEEESEEMQSDRFTQLESQVQRLTEMMQSFMMGQTTIAPRQLQPETEQAIEPAQAVSESAPETEDTPPKRTEYTKEWQIYHKDELWGAERDSEGNIAFTPLRGKGTADERIIRSIEAIMRYNNQAKKGDKWLIGNTTIRELASAGGKVVGRVLDERPELKKAIDDHHAFHGIDTPFWNRMHHKGYKSQEFVNLMWDFVEEIRA